MIIDTLADARAKTGAGVLRRLTERDRKLLLFLGAYGCVTAGRIKAKFWNGNSNSTAHYRRLRWLKRLGLVEVVGSDPTRTIGYRLSKRGKKVAGLFGKFGEVTLIRRNYSTQFEHDQLLIDVQEILEKSPLVKDYRTEDQVKRELFKGKKSAVDWRNAPKIPDATFVLEVPGQKMRVAVELELSVKMKRRYGKIFRNHLLSRDWNLVFYIAKNRMLMEWLMATLREVKANDAYIRVSETVSGIYFCSLEEFLLRRLETPFSNGKEEISLDQIASNFGIKR